MKLITEVKGICNLEKYRVHGLIFNHEFLSDTHEGFLTLDEVEKLVEYKEKNSVFLLANINRIFTEDELLQVYQLIDTFLELNIDYFIFSDLAVLAYFKEKNIQEKLIYNARTMVTNFEDALFWKNEGLYASFIANELPLEDITKISQVEHGVLEVYGFHQIFYSKRNLLSLYFQHKQIDENHQYKRLDLIEEIRDEKYPITETNHGTYIYSPYKYGIFKELAQMSKLKMIKVSSTFIPEEELFKVLDIYYQAIQTDFNDELHQELIEIDEDVRLGFLYQKTVLLKGEEQ